ncbi:MAG: hypothetical protein QM767_23635 [Anaeromyxobacter sp.]
MRPSSLAVSRFPFVWLVLLAGCDGCERLTQRLSQAADPTATRTPIELTLSPAPEPGTTVAPAVLDAAAAALRRRLDRSGVRGTVEVLGGKLRVVVAPGFPERYRSNLHGTLTLPLRIGFQEVAEEALKQAAPFVAAPAQLRSDELGSWVSAPDEAGAEAAARALRPHLPRGISAQLQAPSGPGGPWSVLALHPPELGGETVQDARVVYDERPVLALQLDREGAARLDALSRRLIDRRLAITLDGRVLLAPLVTGPIPEGRVQIPLGGRDGAEAGLERAEELALVLKLGAPLPVALAIDGEQDLER